jgi:EmrB/QacA subfamily drug resistance transporter
MNKELASSRFPCTYFCKHSKWRYFILITVLIGATMSAINVTIVNIALPTIQLYFRTSLHEVEWVAMGYMLAITVLLPFFGKLGDMYGRTKLYTLGFVIFSIASFFCGLASNINILNIFRVFQAIGAGLLQANSVAIITDAFPKEELGRAIGIQGAVQAIAMALGAFVGGAIVSAIGWRYIFYVNVPLGIMGTLVGIAVLPRSLGSKKGSIDYIGAFLLATALFTFIFALNKGDSYGWTSIKMLALILITLISLPFFIYRELKAKSPMIKLSIFKNWGFLMGNTLGLLSYLIFFSVLFLMPYYLELIQDYTPIMTGTLLTPIPMAMGIMAPIAGYASDIVGRRFVIAVGFSVISLAIFMLLFLKADSSFIYIVTIMIVLGGGMGLFTPPNNSQIMLSVSSENRGVAGGILNMMRSLGLVIGVAVTGLVFSSVHSSYIYSHFHKINNSIYKHLWNNYELFVKTVPPEIVTKSFIHAFFSSMIMLFLLSLISIVLCVLKQNKTLKI